jgi:acyl-CoA thioesterase-1
MKLLPLLLSLLCLSLSAAPKYGTQDFDRDQGEDWNRGPAKDIAGLPRVLLYCDFVTIDACYLVRQKLAGKANVHVGMCTGRQTQTEWAPQENWFHSGKFDVIHFTCGLHIMDLPDKVNPQQQPHIEPREYEKGVRACVAFLKKTHAKLIFSTMTTAPDEAQVDPYNKIALKVMKENGITVDDLNADIGPALAKLQRPLSPEWKRIGSEFYTDEGFDVLGQAIAKSVSATIKK